MATAGLSRGQIILAAKIGLFYGSSTCYTEMVAERIQSVLGEDVVDLHNVADADLSQLNNYDFLLFGIPTWDYGELQEDWDDRWDDLDNYDLSGIPSAIFGLGDQQGYADWFQDAMGYLFYKLKSMGAELTGLWPNEGYDFKESKGLTPDRKFFLGLSLDDENQPELTEERLITWLRQIGLLE